MEVVPMLDVGSEVGGCACLRLNTGVGEAITC